MQANKIKIGNKYPAFIQQILCIIKKNRAANKNHFIPAGQESIEMIDVSLEAPKIKELN